MSNLISLTIKREVHKKIKVQAAINGLTISDYLNKIVPEINENTTIQ